MTDNPNIEFTISEELILVKEDAQTQEEIIQKLGGLLQDQGFVKDSYIQAVIDREKVYPTGLKARATGVAVPHTDTEHVNKPAVAIATLNSPLTFGGMGMPDTEVSVYIIMMLAIHDPKLVVNILRKVIMVIENDEALNSMLSAGSSLEIKEIMQNHIALVSK